jgi:hypothetical protein
VHALESCSKIKRQGLDRFSHWLVTAEPTRLYLLKHSCTTSWKNTKLTDTELNLTVCDQCSKCYTRTHTEPQFICQQDANHQPDNKQLLGVSYERVKPCHWQKLDNLWNKNRHTSTHLTAMGLLIWESKSLPLTKRTPTHQHTWLQLGS